ncbi:MAG: hypothetical protein L0Y55_16300 [Anaerolineales bacterium]|nr:hypothetical protein [Anaerolineales bacterium]
MAFIPKERNKVWRGFALRDLNEANGIFLDAAHEIRGVQETLIGDRTGELLGAYVGANWDKPKASALVAQVARLLHEAEQGRAPAREVEARSPQGGLFVRGLGNAFAVFICAPTVDWAMMRMTVNVAATPYETNPLLQNYLNAARETQMTGRREPDETDDSNMWAKFP